MTTRERILEAAMEVFARFGFRRAAMDQVAREAGVTRQAVYHHFASKEALFRAAVEDVHQGALEAEIAAGQQAEAAGADLADIVAAQVEGRFRYLLECLAETVEPEELLGEREVRTRDLHQSFGESSIGLHAETITRVAAAQGLRLSGGVSALELARALRLATRSFGDLRFDARAVGTIGQIVRLMVRGAVEPKPAAAAPARAKPGKSRKQGKGRAAVPTTAARCERPHR